MQCDGLPLLRTVAQVQTDPIFPPLPSSHKRYSVSTQTDAVAMRDTGTSCCESTVGLRERPPFKEPPAQPRQTPVTARACQQPVTQQQNPPTGPPYPLPTGWYALWDAIRHRPYYVNRPYNYTTWHMPIHVALRERPPHTTLWDYYKLPPPPPPRDP